MNSGTRKLFSLLLVLVFVLSLSPAVFADAGAPAESTEPAGAADIAGGTDHPADGIADPTDSADASTDGATEAANGTNDPTDGTADPADGAADPADGAADTADGAADPADGAADPADGAADPADGAADPADGAADPADGTADTADGAEDAADGAADTADGAADPADGTEAPAAPAAKILETGTEYGTLDDAVAAAESGQTIELLADCTTEGLNLNKDLTIKGSYKVSFSKYGIALWGVSLTFEGCTVEMNGVGSTPYTGEWNWMAICASPGASLTLNGAAMTMNGSGAGNAHAIYFCSNNKLNLNGSYLHISNYAQDALEWDGGDGGYNVNITNSTFISDSNRSGFTGTFVAKIDNSKVNVINSTGNGSNGSHFEIVNGSEVNFNNNASHGLSAGDLTISGATVTANGNGANGVHTTGKLTVNSGSSVTITGNGCAISSKWTIPGALYIAGESVMENCTVTITGNSGSGIYQKAGSLTVAPSTKLTVTNNTAVKLGIGGGLNVNGTMSLHDGVVLYNNHAATAADDIYVSGGASLRFGPVGSGWALDGTAGSNDCLKAIDGWYDDGEGSRWDTHSLDTLHAVLIPSGTLSGVSLKAAHGLGFLESVEVVDMPLYKVDSVTGEVIPNVTFTLYADSACTQALGEYVTDATGLVTLKELSVGNTYYLKETKAADNYIPFDYAINIQVVEGAENSYTDKPVLVDGEVLLETLHAFGEFQMVSQEENLVTLDDGSIAITNDAVVNAVIQKVWVDGGKTDGRTDSVKVQLLANGKVLEEYELSAKNNWSVSVTLPKYDAEGREIQYSVTETSKVDGYIASYKGFTVYNTLQSLKPQTGDDSNIALWLTVMAVCAAGLGAVTLICKRSKA